MIKEEIQVKELIAECLKTKGTEARERDVVLEEDLADPAATMRGDRRLLRTAVTNMIDASIKRNRPGGKVTVGHSRDNVRETIVVSGSGEGIPYEELRQPVRPLQPREHVRSRCDRGHGQPPREPHHREGRRGPARRKGRGTQRAGRGCCFQHASSPLRGVTKN